MVTNCPNCGSPIKTDGKFCTYCGAKLPDDVKRVEVKIDNTAEIARAEYEAQESQLRQKKMKRELRKEQMRPYVTLAKVLSGVLPLALALTGWFGGVSYRLLVTVGIAFSVLWLCRFLLKQ